MSETALVPLLLTESQVALLLGVSTRTVQRLAAAKKLRPVPIGAKRTGGNEGGHKARVRYKRREVLKLAEEGWTW